MDQDQKSFEVVPSKWTGPPEQLEENMRNLTVITNLFIDAIVKSVERCPTSVRKICHLLKKEVSDRFQNCEHSVIGGFIFLRFICPAIVSPVECALLPPTAEPISKNLQRALILISKILQQISNGVEFGEKEESMMSLNSIIFQNMDRVKKYLNSLADPSSDLRRQDSDGLTSSLIVRRQGSEPSFATPICEEVGTLLHNELVSHLEQVLKLAPKAELTEGGAIQRLLEILTGLPSTLDGVSPSTSVVASSPTTQKKPTKIFGIGIGGRKASISKMPIVRHTGSFIVAETSRDVIQPTARRQSTDDLVAQKEVVKTQIMQLFQTVSAGRQAGDSPTNTDNLMRLQQHLVSLEEVLIQLGKNLQEETNNSSGTNSPAANSPTLSHIQPSQSSQAAFLSPSPTISHATASTSLPAKAQSNLLRTTIDSTSFIIPVISRSSPP